MSDAEVIRAALEGLRDAWNDYDRVVVGVGDEKRSARDVADEALTSLDRLKDSKEEGNG